MTRILYRQATERFLYLYVTSACNLRCKHCYVGNDRLNNATYITVEKAAEIMEYFRVTGGHDKLYILGGEPTMHPHLDEIVNIANKKGYSVTISSNGLFGEDIFEKISSANLASFNFSIESADPAIHSNIRGRSDGFEKVSYSIKRAAELDYHVRVMCTVNNINAASAFDLIDYISDLGACTLSFHNLGLTGNAAKFLRPLSSTEWMNFCERLEKLPRHPHLAVYYPPTFVKADKLNAFFDRGYSGCSARTLDRPHVLPDGTVYLCPMLLDNNIPFAKFFNGKLVFNQETGSELEGHLRMDPTCLDCPYGRICGGGCPAYLNLDAYADASWYKCERDIIPICILWTTYAWEKKPETSLHEFR